MGFNFFYLKSHWTYLNPTFDHLSIQSIINYSNKNIYLILTYLVKSAQEETDGPANNLRREGVCFHKEPANVGKIRDNFLLNMTIPLWNDLPFKVK